VERYSVKYFARRMAVLPLFLLMCASPEKQSNRFIDQIMPLVANGQFRKADSLYGAVREKYPSNLSLPYRYGDLLNGAGRYSRAAWVVSACSTADCKSVFMSAFGSIGKLVNDTPLDSIDWRDYLALLERSYGFQGNSFPRARALLAALRLIDLRVHEWDRAGAALGAVDTASNAMDSPAGDCSRYKAGYLKGSIDAENVQNWEIEPSRLPGENSFATGTLPAGNGVDCASAAYCQGLVHGAIAQLKKKIHASTTLDSVTANFLERCGTFKISINELKAALKKGVVVNAQDVNGRTLLMLESCNHSEPLVQYLLTKGADWSIKDEDGSTALQYAIRHNNVDAFKALIKAGADYRQTTGGGSPFLLAARSCRYEMLNLLLDKGVDPNSENDLRQNALMLAVAEELPYDPDSSSARMINKVLALLLDHGTRIDEIDTVGYTVLMYAAEFYQEPARHFLLARGARRDLKNHKGETADDILKRKKSPEKL
jgi:ankyrin repeat protein